MFPVNNMYIFPQECAVIICKMLYLVIMPKWQKNIKEGSGKGMSHVFASTKNSGSLKVPMNI